MREAGTFGSGEISRYTGGGRGVSRGSEPSGSAISRVDSRSTELATSSWLAQFINPEILGRMRKTPWGETHSDEFLLYDRLLGVLVEQSHAWDPAQTAKLRRFVNGFRVAIFPNLQPEEQEQVMAGAATWSTATIDADEIRTDMRWTWTTFGLRIPDPAAEIAGQPVAEFYKQIGLTGTE